MQKLIRSHLFIFLFISITLGGESQRILLWFNRVDCIFSSYNSSGNCLVLMVLIFFSMCLVRYPGGAVCHILISTAIPDHSRRCLCCERVEMLFLSDASCCTRVSGRLSSCSSFLWCRGGLGSSLLLWLSEDMAGAAPQHMPALSSLPTLCFSHRDPTGLSVPLAPTEHHPMKCHTSEGGRQQK